MDRRKTSDGRKKPIIKVNYNSRRSSVQMTTDQQPDTNRSSSLPRKKKVTICSKVSLLGDDLKIENFKANHDAGSACSDPFERADSFDASPKMNKVQERNQKVSFVNKTIEMQNLFTECRRSTGV